MKKIILMMVLALSCLTTKAGPNDLLWDYTNSSPTSSPDNGLYFARANTNPTGILLNGYSYDWDFSNWTEEFGAGIVNSGTYAYFTKAAVPGTLELTYSGGGIKIYKFDDEPYAQHDITTTPSASGLSTHSVSLSATQNNIFLIDNDERVVLQKIRFTQDESSIGDDAVVGSGTCGDNLTWTFTSNGILTISGSGELIDPTYFSDTPWAYYCTISKGKYVSGINQVIIEADYLVLKENVIPAGIPIVTGENVNVIYLEGAYTDVTCLSSSTRVFRTISKIPEDISAFYDINGDGEMEFNQYYYPDYGESSVCQYTWRGVKLAENLPNISGDKNDYYLYYSYVNFNNDTLIDIAPSVTSCYEDCNNDYINTDNGYTELGINWMNAQNYRRTVDYDPLQLKHFLLDANLDGLMDFYSNENVEQYSNPMGTHYFHLRQADGSYVKKELEILLDTVEIEEALLQLWDNSSEFSPMYWSSMPSVGEGFMVRAPKRHQSQSADSRPLMVKLITSSDQLSYDDFTSIDLAIDLDRNGLIDLMSTKSGAVLYNLGDYKFLIGQFQGNVTIKDLNADGIMDYVIYDEDSKTVTLQIYQGDGLFKTQTLMQNMAISGVWCYDFDKDGDVDILLPFDYSRASGYAYLVFFRNDGTTFKKVENALDDPIWHFKFVDCKDVDNDGKYEILALDSIGYLYSTGDECKMYKGDYYVIRYNNRLKVSVDDEPFVRNTITDEYGVSKYPSPIIADFNNDGVLDFITTRPETNSSLLATFNPATPNTAPAKMSAPRFVLDAQRQMINISWDRGNDTECSALDLEYSIRIGSESGKSDVWFVAAGADGKQRSLSGGNVGAWLNQWVNVAGWAEGDYYIAVQAIDPSGLGGAWSDETVYHHSLLSAEFTLDKVVLATVDTLTVAYQGAANPNYTYTWNFGDSAIILAQEGQSYKIAYNTNGMKTISLQVTNAAGQKSLLVEKQVQVDAVRFVEEVYESLSYVDLDGDGVMEGFGESNSIFGFFTYKNGDFKKVAKTYNTDITNNVGYSRRPSFLNVWDYNMDGLPDVIYPTSKGTVMINDWDLDIDFRDIQFSFTYPDRYTEEESDLAVMLYNLNLDNYDNNGRLGFRGYMSYNGQGYSGFYRYSSSTESTYTFSGYGEYGWGDYYEVYKWYNYPKVTYFDYDKDGLLDKVSKNEVGINNGDGTYSTITKGSCFGWMDDFNNDGYLDVMDWADQKTLRLYLGDADNSYSEYIDMKLPGAYTLGNSYKNHIYSVRDVDNNGYLDLLVHGEYDGGSLQVGFIVYIYPDWSITLQPIEKGTSTYDMYYVLEGYPFVDINDDGIPDINNYYYGTCYSLKSRITNEAPALPTNLRVTQTEKGLLCSWDAAVDRETPAAQMRYNISIKKASAEVGDENAFIISPVNGLSDDAAIVPAYPYWRGTNFIVPIYSFEVGEEYELQVQSIDLWGAHSAMSAPLTFTVEAQVSIAMPVEACKGASVSVGYIGTETGEQNWNFDGGEATANQAGGYDVLWNTGGTKNVSLTINGITSTRAIYVRDNDDTDLSFTLPEAVLSKTWVEFMLPEAFKDPSAHIYMRTSDNLEDADCVNTKQGETCLGKIQRLQGSLKARVRFAETSSTEDAWIEFYQEDPTCGEKNTFRATTTIMGYAPAPAISIVTVDGVTGKNQVIWDMPSNLPDYVDRIFIYKEEGSTNNWVRQAEIAVSAGSWIDMASDPAVRKNRYCMTYGTNFGAESDKSAAHSSTHLQLNVGLHGAVNLIWTKYEGGTIDSYRILRGATPDNMSVIATVPGTENTYTDLNASEDAYYALEYDNLYFDEWVWITSTGAPARVSAEHKTATHNGHSNIMASAESNEVVFASSINICAMERVIALNPEQTALHLYAEVMPAMATYKRASWKIVSGTDLATIDDNGLLIANTQGLNGTLRVRATAIDGSGIYAEKDIEVSGMELNIPIESIVLTSISGGTIFTIENREIVVQANILPEDATETELAWDLLSGTDKVTLNPAGKQCTLTMLDDAEDGLVLLSASAQDGSGLYATITLVVNMFGDPSEVQDVESDYAPHKVLRDGQLFILRDGKTYTVQGQEVE